MCPTIRDHRAGAGRGGRRRRRRGHGGRRRDRLWRGRHGRLQLFGNRSRFRQHGGQVNQLAQPLKRGAQSIEPCQQGFELRAAQILDAEVLDRRLHAVRHFAQAHRSGQPGATLERVQNAQCLDPGAQVVRSCTPLAQRPAELGKQLLRLFFEDREQVGVEGVDQVDVLVGGAACSPGSR